MRTGLWRDSRLQSLMVIAVLVIGALVLVTDTLLTWRAEANVLAAYEERTGLLEEKAAAAIEPLNSGATPGVGGGKILLEAQTRGLVSAEFQRLLSSRAEQVGAVVRTVDVPEGDLANAGTDAPPPDSLERIRLTADIEVMEQSLPDLLYAIEVGSPVMVIDAFTLRLNRKVDILGETAASTGTDRPLSLSVTLSAFRDKEPGS